MTEITTWGKLKLQYYVLPCKHQTQAIIALKSGGVKFYLQQ